MTQTTIENDVAVSIAWWNECAEWRRLKMLSSVDKETQNPTVAECWERFGRAEYRGGWRPDPELLREAEAIVAAG